MNEEVKKLEEKIENHEKRIVELEKLLKNTGNISKIEQKTGLEK